MTVRRIITVTTILITITHRQANNDSKYDTFVIFLQRMELENWNIVNRGRRNNHLILL